MLVYAIDYDETASLNPEIVNKLYDDQNNFIIIYTARPEYLRKNTIIELLQKGINYHSLVMSKLRADVYIDDKNQGGLKWPESCYIAQD